MGSSRGGRRLEIHALQRSRLNGLLWILQMPYANCIYIDVILLVLCCYSHHIYQGGFEALLRLEAHRRLGVRSQLTTLEVHDLNHQT